MEITKVDMNMSKMKEKKTIRMKKKKSRCSGIYHASIVLAIFGLLAVTFQLYSQSGETSSGRQLLDVVEVTSGDGDNYETKNDWEYAVDDPCPSSANTHLTLNLLFLYVKQNDEDSRINF